MTVHELIRHLAQFDPDQRVEICADNGTAEDPADLSSCSIRRVDPGGPEFNGQPTVALWCPWKTFIETPLEDDEE